MRPSGFVQIAGAGGRRDELEAGEGGGLAVVFGADVFEAAELTFVGAGSDAHAAHDPSVEGAIECGLLLAGDDSVGVAGSIADGRYDDR